MKSFTGEGSGLLLEPNLKLGWSLIVLNKVSFSWYYPGPGTSFFPPKGYLLDFPTEKHPSFFLTISKLGLYAFGEGISIARFVIEASYSFIPIKYLGPSPILLVV